MKTIFLKNVGGFEIQQNNKGQYFLITNSYDGESGYRQSIFKDFVTSCVKEFGIDQITEWEY